MSKIIYFEKMNGIGNSLALIDARAGKKMAGFEPSKEVIIGFANRVGYDQLLVLRPSEEADCFMDIYNKDGSPAEACLNGTRAAMLYLYLSEGKTREDYIIDTIAGSFAINHIIGSNKQYNISIKLAKAPQKVDRELPQVAQDIIDELPVHTIFHGFVDVGNPHIVFFVEAKDGSELEGLVIGYGSKLEQIIDPKNGINVSFACQERQRSDYIHLRTWERGAGMTRACGSAAVATAFLYSMRYPLSDIVVIQAGGMLSIELDKTKMSGEAEHESREKTTL